MRKIISFALALIMLILLGLTSCADKTEKTDNTTALTTKTGETTGSDETTGSEETGEQTTKAEDTTKSADTTKAPEVTQPVFSEVVYKTAQNVDRLKIVGRYTVTTIGITSDWSASGIEFNAVCKDSVTVKVSASAPTYYTVYVDGVRQEKRYLVSGTADITIAQNLSEGSHSFRILKQSHVYHSNTVIESITLKGTLSAPPENKKYYIEFIGDSITCGYGLIFNKIESGVNYGTYEYADATQAYAYLTAESLKTDYSLFSVSGWGISCGTTTIPQIYAKTQWLRNSEAYSFQRKANLIVINLGTNDASKAVNTATFMSDAKAFITTVRAKNNNAPVIWVYNMMSDGYQTYIKQVISEMGGEGAGLYTLSLNRDRNGGGSHPSLAGQKTASEMLTNFIKSKNLLP